MKKILLLLLITLLIVPSLFATAYVSGTASPLSFSKSTMKYDDGSKITSKEFSISGSSNLGVQAGYLYSFSEKNEIGAEVGLGYALSKEKNTETGEDDTTETLSTLSLTIDLAYRYIVSEKLSLLGKVGFLGNFSKQSDENDSDIKMNLYGMNFNAGLLYALTKNVDLSFGVNLDTLFGGKMKEDGTTLDDVKLSRILFYPYIGIAYLF